MRHTAKGPCPCKNLCVGLLYSWFGPRISAASNAPTIVGASSNGLTGEGIIVLLLPAGEGDLKSFVLLLLAGDVGEGVLGKLLGEKGDLAGGAARTVCEWPSPLHCPCSCWGMVASCAGGVELVMLGVVPLPSPPWGDAFACVVASGLFMLGVFPLAFPPWGVAIALDSSAFLIDILKP